MLHHLSIGVTDLDRSARFYDAILSALRYHRVWTDGTAVGYGIENRDDKFAIKLRSAPISVPDGFHVAFAAPDRSAVGAFHQAALTQGGSDDGEPGFRPQYGPDYHAAYVIDPDGWHVEAVIIGPS
ncbi:MAG TPA: VOC family protein [Methylocella sp.]|jgi:catechol 2,3-dioxygenase-like lactoylglutathione lyase family enzyme